MRAADLLENLRQSPFVRFRIRITDGTVYEIRHPELIKVGMTKADIYFPKDDKPHSVVLRRESVSLVHMIRMEPIEQAMAASNNGSVDSAN